MNPLNRWRDHRQAMPKPRELQRWIAELSNDGLFPDLRFFTEKPIAGWKTLEAELQGKYAATLYDSHGRGRAIRETFTPERVGEALRESREKAGLSQGDAAEVALVTTATISRWENGQRQPRIMELAVLASAYGTTISELLPMQESRGAAKDVARTRKGE